MDREIHLTIIILETRLHLTLLMHLHNCNEEVFLDHYIVQKFTLSKNPQI